MAAVAPQLVLMAATRQNLLLGRGQTPRQFRPLLRLDLVGMADTAALEAVLGEEAMSSLYASVLRTIVFLPAKAVLLGGRQEQEARGAKGLMAV